jgi:hypothetical protein
MATLTDIALELTDLQDTLANPIASNVMKQSIIASLVRKIERLPAFEGPQAVGFVAALHASSLESAHADALRTAIDKRLEETLTAGKARKTAKDPQVLVHQLQYLTNADWMDIESPGVSSNRVMQVIQSRLVRLGVRSLAEQTVKTAVQIVLWRHLQVAQSWPTYHHIHGWVQEFKNNFKAHAKLPWLHDVLVQYPVEPTGLPPSTLSAAYDPEDPPISKVLNNFKDLSSHVILRSDSIKLRQAPTMVNTQGPQSHASQFVTMADVQRLMRTGHQPEQQCLPGFKIYGSLRQPDAVAQSQSVDSRVAHQPSDPEAALVDASPLAAARPGESPLRSGLMVPSPMAFKPAGARVGAPALPAPSEEIEPHPVCVKGEPLGHEAFEDAAFQMLVSKSDSKKRPAAAMKRPAAATPIADAAPVDDGKGKPVAKGKAYAKPKAVAAKPSAPTVGRLKKPASKGAALHAGKYKVPLVTAKIIKHTSLHSFSSNAYHNTKKHYLAQGKSLADAAKHARATYASVVAQWKNIQVRKGSFH